MARSRCSCPTAPSAVLASTPSSTAWPSPQHPSATLTLHNWNVFGAALKSGDIGFAESYIAGDWSTPNLTELLKLFCANRQQVEAVIYGTWAGRLLYRLKHLLQHNSRANSRKNIHAHYDLGNAFYELWLDETMNYSSAWFEGDLSQPMAQAQNAKVRRALQQARVKRGDRVLEIGCGWGALAEQATVLAGRIGGGRHAQHRTTGLGQQPPAAFERGHG